MKIERVQTSKKSVYSIVKNVICNRWCVVRGEGTTISVDLPKNEATLIAEALNKDPENVDKTEIVIRLSATEARDVERGSPMLIAPLARLFREESTTNSGPKE